MNAYEEMLAGYADPDVRYPDVDNFNAGYADADLCSKIMSLCCIMFNKIQRIFLNYAFIIYCEYIWTVAMNNNNEIH